jgi:hypothetical protein
MKPPKPSRAEFLSLFQKEVRSMWPTFDGSRTVTAGAARRLVQELGSDLRRAVPAPLASTLTAEQWISGLSKVATQTDVFGAVARALLALAKGDAAAATDAAAIARKLAPDSTSVEILTGAAHAAAGRDREAVDVWRDAVGTLAADPDWSLPFAEALGRTGDYEGALEALSLLPRDPSRLESVRAIDAAIALGRYDEARAAAEKGSGGTGAYQSRLAFYTLVFLYADALDAKATDRTKQAFMTSARTFVKSGADLAPLVQSWIDSLEP